MVVRFSLKVKLLIAFLCVGIIPFATMAVIVLYKADLALHDQAYAQIQSMRDVKKGRLQNICKPLKSGSYPF